MYRYSYVSVNTLYAGVLSGSVLGPLLFLIYVNDANNMLTFCRLDNSLQDSSEKLKIIENNINKNLLELENWSKKWLLKFIPTKTKVMYFNTKNVFK